MFIVAQSTGMVTGGWSFVWAAYGVTWLFFGGYAATLYLRHREEQ